MKTYKIIVKDGWMPKLKEELGAWGINDNMYQIVVDTLITSNRNVVNVATETFRENLHLIRIESIPFDKPFDYRSGQAQDVPNG